MPILSTILLIVGGYSIYYITIDILTTNQMYIVAFGTFLIYCSGVINDE